MSQARRRDHAPGFTLVELLVVILIITLLSVATIAAVLPAFNARRVSEGSRLVQSLLAQARDLAINDNKPHGIRLLPDPIDLGRPSILTCSRILAIEAAPEYDDGVLKSYFDVAVWPPIAATATTNQNYPPPPGAPPYVGTWGTFPQIAYPYLVVHQAKTYQEVVGGTTLILPNPPTGWFFNLKQGEKVQLNNAGQVYTVAGPIANPAVAVTPNSSIATAGSPAANPERFINYGPVTTYFASPDPSTTNFEFLYLVDGIDNDGDGFIDEAFDGRDNDGDGVTDPGFNGIDDNGNGFIDEWQEMYFSLSSGSATYPGCPDTNFPNGGYPYFPSGMTRAQQPGFYPNEYELEDPGRLPTAQFNSGINRRPAPSTGAREVPMPTNVVIDLTTTSLGVPERSVLPLDVATGYTDVMISPNGQVVAMDANGNSAPAVKFPFYHFWITERDDVHEVISPPSPFGFKLPMPKDAFADPRGPNSGSASYIYPSTLVSLKGDRRLLSLNTRTGSITSTLIEQFYTDNTDYPYEAAERGVKDVQP